MIYESLFKPIGIFPMPIPLYPFPLTENTAQIIAYYFIFVLVALILGGIIYNICEKNFEIKSPIDFILPVVISLLLAFRFGFSLEFFKGIILTCILIYASNSDIKKREVLNFVPVMILITAFVGVDVLNIPQMLIGACLITLPQLLIATLNKGSYGGADIKIMAACAFLLGLNKGVFALVLGLTLAIMTTIIIRKKQDLKLSIPLVPYLSIGVMLVYLI
jgi:leader peptidase (prepilin peptidase)/N-methyltransferase